jgi:hypothetical protein
MGCDLVEVSAHSGARPEHAAWQGEIYSRSGKSKKYPNFAKVTGYGTGAGLGGWNCSHSFRPWFEGMGRTYNKDLLEDYEAKKFEYNGKKLTEYEALQEQRHIERGIRRWKREQNALAAAGLDTSEASSKLWEWNWKHKDFLEQTGLKADETRTAVGRSGVVAGKMYKQFVENPNKNAIIKINLQFFAEKDIKNQESASLKRAIRKYQKQIKEHQGKINDPKKYIEAWDSFDVRRQEGLKKHWSKEIRNFETSIKDRVDELKARGDYDE